MKLFRNGNRGGEKPGTLIAAGGTMLQPLGDSHHKLPNPCASSAG